ncbi:MAG: sigma 54-interacting transcriptional regulator [Phycisphaerales bacterium]|nr:sigma 54-interacting transcriptional regulator [Phycisphaerales bacterium]
MRALRAIADALNHYSGQHKILQEVLHALESLVGLCRCTVMLLSPDGKELTVEDIPKRGNRGRADARYSRGEGITGQVLQTGHAAIVARISQEPQFRNRIHRRGPEASKDFSFICVPVMVGEEVVGTLSADHPCSPANVLNEVKDFLLLVAGLIANDVKARRVAQQQQMALEEENIRLRGELEGIHRPENIIGNSRPMRQIYQRIQQVASGNTTVLIRGESGTGKELVAAAIHYSSPRCGKPFVRVNCAALSENLLESELFGHEKGAFTSAITTRIGRIEQAEGGTLFLDEIGDFSTTVQIKLLRILQERQYERVGDNETRSANVRILAATNRNLEADVEAGRFRHDLYYRINVFPIYLPTLRDRKDDILSLADHFVAKYARAMEKDVHRISTSAIQMMLAYHWPGNVRELENCIEHAVLLSNDGVIHGSSLPPTLQVPSADEQVEPMTLKARVRILERDLITDALKRHEGSVVCAATELGITERMVRYKIKSLAIDYKGLFRK